MVGSYEIDVRFSKRSHTVLNTIIDPSWYFLQKSVDLFMPKNHWFRRCFNLIKYRKVTYTLTIKVPLNI